MRGAEVLAPSAGVPRPLADRLLGELRGRAARVVRGCLVCQLARRADGRTEP